MTPVDAARLRAKATKASAGALRPAMVCSALDVLGLLDAHKLAREALANKQRLWHWRHASPCRCGNQICTALARLDALVTPEVTP